ncbi:hypothetical protein FA13DRAFT_1787427 [Coprinellus micaceus]|uniref:Uncharacterized protein n=1 Tax=Coprinellus micaceus TaxID=71717 RepID=A0A4Y7TP32_COPMI|nr:hypothetical protein FA13DRAFT_1787427 [Coprinellus micaceus]
MIGEVVLIIQTTAIHDRSLHHLAGLLHHRGGNGIARLGLATIVPHKALTKSKTEVVIASIAVQKSWKETVTTVSQTQPLAKQQPKPPSVCEPTKGKVPFAAHRPMEHPAYDTPLAAQFVPVGSSSTKLVEEEPLELGQLEPETTIKDEPMDVEPVKHEEVAVSLPIATTSDSATVEHSNSPGLSPRRHRTPTPLLAMAVDEQKPDIQPPSPIKEEPVYPPVKIELKLEPSIPTRPRRFFEDHPPVRAARSSPGAKSEGRHYGRDERYSPGLSHLHARDSPNSPRSPRFKGEDKFYEHSRRSSAMHTPSIPAQELAGSAAHSPRLPSDATPIERAISGSEHKPSFMRMGPRTEHEPGRHPYSHREGAHAQEEKEKPVETLYNPADLQDFKLKHQKRLLLEQESEAMACQLYTDMQELSLALLDLQSAQARTKLAGAMSDLARVGKLGIDYPLNRAAVLSGDRAGATM